MKIIRITVGVILVTVGLVALVTPLTPGAWVGLIGLELLGLGFLIPKKVRSLIDRKLIARGYPPLRSDSPPASPLDDSIDC